MATSDDPIAEGDIGRTVTVVPSRNRAAMSKDRLFYMGMAIAFIVAVFLGFAPTYYLKSYFGAASLKPLVHLHGLLFTMWIVLVFAQTFLIASRRVQTHRRLGMAGVGLAALMVVVGGATAAVFARRNFATLGPGILAPLTEIFLFAILAVAGIVYRRHPEAHKRLMLLASIALLHAAIGRWRLGILQSGLLPNFIVTDLFVVAGIGYDLLSRRRIHPAYLWGGTLLVLSQLVRNTSVWLAFLGWLVL